MQTSLDCIPCIIRQALEAARLAAGDYAVHERVLRDVLRMTSELDLAESPPMIGQKIHRRLRELTGTADPYRHVKQHATQMALEMLPELSSTVAVSEDPFRTALLLAIAGNVVDMGPEGSVNHSALRFAMWKVLSEPFHGIAEDLRSAAETADKILYLADNAGELVFDWPLIEQLGPEHVTVAVRGHAVLNDATLEDAKAAGLDQWVEVVGNGSDAPGTVLEDCSPSFQRRFHEADLIIAKGPGNFEALSDEPAKIFFLFKVRCSVISGRIGLPIGTHVLLRPGIAAVKGVFNHAQA